MHSVGRYHYFVCAQGACRRHAQSLKPLSVNPYAGKSMASNADPSRTDVTVNGQHICSDHFRLSFSAIHDSAVAAVAHRYWS